MNIKRWLTGVGAGEILIKENVSVLEEPSASQTPSAGVGNAAGKA